MTSAEIRQSFLDFFRRHQHTIVPSASLLPDSPGLLFTNAGMNQFVPIFLNERKPDVSKWAGVDPASDTRAADTQKCIRAGGKHNDLEDVGWDTYHHTFFEMLGNWSFGDYFKEESLTWGWELLTKIWGIPPKRLFATVYAPDKARGDPADFDQEAYDLWARLFQEAGLDPAVHIVNGNKKDNFWMMGDTGPCGPCSEIHFNLLESDDEEAGRKLVNAGSPRCIEIWNHVFIQLNAGADGSFSPLPAKHVDTGMGFERVAGIYAGTKGFKDFSREPSNYDADIFTDLFARIKELTRGKHVYTGTVPIKREELSDQEKTDIAFRVIADHARCVCCAIADGIIPGNTDRNYVIRRILRRGILYGRKDLGLETGFLEKLVPTVIAALGTVFPELKEQQPIIERVIRSEEESFGRTLDRGLVRFRQLVDGPGSARVPRAASGVPPEVPVADPIRYSKRRLPHFERPWGKYHVTFSTRSRRELSPAARRIVFDSLLHGQNEGRYLLFAAVVMPDHVHILLEPQPRDRSASEPTDFHPLAEILRSIKSFTAHAINKAEGTSGSVWDKESHDRLIRSEGDLQEKFTYIAKNPREAGIADANGDYPYLYLGGESSERVRRDAEPGPRDAGAPRTGADADSPHTIAGAAAFELYDTYGFPLDMTQLLAAERGLTVDVAGFEAEMEKQRAQSRAAQKKEVVTVQLEDSIQLSDSAEAAATRALKNKPTNFVGYSLPVGGSIDGKVEDVVKSGDDTFLVFDQSPFYAEMGGQTGDTGTVTIGDLTFEIVDTIKDKAGRFLHQVAPDSPSASPDNLHGKHALLHVDTSRRRAISRHHSAVHLLHWALRQVLGTHVRQAGTSKTPDRARFDFSHFEQVKPEQLREIERLVNEKVIDNAEVEAYETEFDQKPPDTLAFFGEKYGRIVRVVDIGGYSRELCGGTHVSTTGEIGLVRIVSEMAIAAGTRRIEAVAGEAALRYVDDHETQLKAVSAKLNAAPQDVAQKLDSLLAEKAEIEARLKALQQKAESGLADELAGQTFDRNGLKHVVAQVEATDPNALRALGAQVLGKLGEGVVILGAAFGSDKVSVVALCSPAAIEAGAKAGEIVRSLCTQLGGKGGGKPDFAMGGGKDVAGLEAALASRRG